MTDAALALLLLPTLIAPNPGSYRVWLLPDTQTRRLRLLLHGWQAGIAQKLAALLHVCPSHALLHQLLVGRGAVGQRHIANIPFVLILLMALHCDGLAGDKRRQGFARCLGIGLAGTLVLAVAGLRRVDAGQAYA